MSQTENMMEMEKKQISRRSFLKVAGITAASGAVLCVGGGLLATRRPKVPYLRDICGTGNEQILVTYATRAGSTAEVAQGIAEELCASGANVYLLPIHEARDLSPYSAVVVGSAIRMGAWVGEATDYIESHRDELAKLPLAYFAVCATLFEENEETLEEVSTYLDNPKAHLLPQSEAVFAGAMDFSKLSILESTVIKAIGTDEGDYRRWDHIQSWANSLVPVMAG